MKKLNGHRLQQLHDQGLSWTQIAQRSGASLSAVAAAARRHRRQKQKRPGK